MLCNYSLRVGPEGVVKLFLIFPRVVIVPRFKSKISTNDGHDFTCKWHFRNGLLSVSAVVLVAFIKTLSHKICLPCCSRAENY